MYMNPDLFISYWFFAWFILYYIFIENLFIRTHLNPKLALLVGLVENIIILAYFFSVKISIGFKYLINIFIFKLIPLYFLRDYPMNLPNDIYILVSICIIYKFYLVMRGEPSIYDIYKKSYKYTLEEKNDDLPFIKLLDSATSFFTRKST
jgi:hypothetical protein